jgi:hypothetical protein
MRSSIGVGKRRRTKRNTNYHTYLIANVLMAVHLFFEKKIIQWETFFDCSCFETEPCDSPDIGARTLSCLSAIYA